LPRGSIDVAGATPLSASRGISTVLNHAPLGASHSGLSQAGEGEHNPSLPEGLRAGRRKTSAWLTSDHTSRVTANDKPKPAKPAGPSKKTITVKQALQLAEPRPPIEVKPAQKKNYAQRFSDALAVCVANRLRKQFKGILPNPDGTGKESRARTA